MSAGAPERDFDDVSANDESDTRAVIEVGLKSFSSKNEVNCSFAPGGLKISTNVGEDVYSKIIPGLTEKHVELPPEIKKSNKSFKVILKKKKVFSIEELFFNG